jgi:ribosomal-protein-alanine N-acetyltransferase
VTPEALADLHAAAFTVPRPWSAGEIAALLADLAVFLVEIPGGFAPPSTIGSRTDGEHDGRPPAGYLSKDENAGFLLGRVVLDEAELLTVAVHPAAQGRGIGGALVAAFLAQASSRGARRAFLEVAEDNASARAVYTRAGFAPVGRRKGYFHAPDGRRIDAIVMARDLPVS